MGNDPFLGDGNNPFAPSFPIGGGGSSSGDGGGNGFLPGEGGAGGLGPNPLGDLLFGPQDPCGTFVDEGIGNAVMMGACGDGQSCLVNGQPGICANWQTVGGSSGDSSPSPTWAGIKSFFTTNPFPTAWESLKSESGCGHIIAETFLKDLSPVPVDASPSVGDAIPFAGKARAAAGLARASAYSMSRGLVEPLKSGTFRALRGSGIVASTAVEDLILPATIVYAGVDALVKSISSAAQGECH